MTALRITLAAIAAGLVFVVAPSLVTTLLIFCGRYDPEKAMRKDYFAPYRAEIDRCAAFLSGLEHTPAAITAPDGTRLAAEYYDRGGDRTVLMLHGYHASALSNFCVSGRAFWERGWNLLLIDQRAHGRSSGNFTVFGLREQYDLLAWIDWAEQNTAAEKLVIYGVSMGCAALCYASDKITSKRVRAMVCDCGFTSPHEQIVDTSRRKHVPWAVMMPFVRLFARLLWGADLKTPVTASLERTVIPAFFLHGEADRTVPVERGRRNYAACASEKEAAFVPGAEHTMSFPTGGGAVQEQLFSFLERNMQ